MKEYVWYSPELDEIKISTKEAGFLFKNKNGTFHAWNNIYSRNFVFSLKTYHFFLIGEL